VSLGSVDDTAAVPVSAEVWKPRRVLMPSAVDLTADLPQMVSAIQDDEDDDVPPPPPRPAPRQEPEIVTLLGPVRRTPAQQLPWIAGIAVMGLLLLVQVLIHYRSDLATISSLNGPLTRLYGAFGMRIVPHWDLGAYDVRQVGPAPARAGQIIVRASIKNSAPRAQPLPLLRVTLQDRFGNRVAARDVPPTSYLPAANPAFLSAGQRIDVEMAFLDPGANAVGFEIEPCLPAPDGGTACE
jgi:hypothetical protein